MTSRGSFRNIGPFWNFKSFPQLIGVSASFESAYSNSLKFSRTAVKLLLAITLLLGAISLDANAAGVLFSDLGAGGSYGTSDYQVYGINVKNSGTGQTAASLFTYLPSRAAEARLSTRLILAPALRFLAHARQKERTLRPCLLITRAFLAIRLRAPTGNFRDTSTPGDVVSITGISGVTLTGGDEYFLVLEPLATDGSLAWYVNNQNITGDVLLSADGGTTWTGGIGTTAASDVLGSSNAAGTPEPSTFALPGAGIALLGLGRACTQTK